MLASYITVATCMSMNNLYISVADTPISVTYNIMDNA